jgi:uncharacterized protein YfeS
MGAAKGCSVSPNKRMKLSERDSLGEVAGHGGLASLNRVLQHMRTVERISEETAWLTTTTGNEVVDAHWEASTAEEVAGLLQEDEFGFTHRDDAIVALAFGLLAFEGSVAPEVRERALMTLRRQALPAAVDLWPPEVQQERRGRLKTMEEILRRL